MKHSLALAAGLTLGLAVTAAQAADSDTTSISYPLPFTLNFILSLLSVSSTDRKSVV